MTQLLGATIADHHTWADFGLMLQSMQLSPLTARTKFITIPGRKTVLDATDALYGGLTYENRTLTLTFIRQGGWRSWLMQESRLNQLMAGQRVEIYLDSEPDRYWSGRGKVTSEKVENFIKVILEFEVDPYKYRRAVPDYDWKWDELNFEEGFLPGGATFIMPSSGVLATTVIAPDYDCFATIHATQDVEIRIRGTVYQFLGGESRELAGIVFNTSEPITITGHGTVDFTFRGRTI